MNVAPRLQTRTNLMDILKMITIDSGIHDVLIVNANDLKFKNTTSLLRAKRACMHSEAPSQLTSDMKHHL